MFFAKTYTIIFLNHPYGRKAYRKERMAKTLPGVSFLLFSSANDVWPEAGVGGKTSSSLYPLSIFLCGWKCTQNDSYVHILLLKFWLDGIRPTRNTNKTEIQNRRPPFAIIFPASLYFFFIYLFLPFCSY